MQIGRAPSTFPSQTVDGSQILADLARPTAEWVLGPRWPFKDRSKGNPLQGDCSDPFGISEPLCVVGTLIGDKRLLS